MTTVSLRSARKVYRPNEAEIDASLTVASGRQMVLLGPSGCGKTTVLRMIAGLIALDGGDVLFDETSMRGVAPDRRGAAMVFQDPQLFPFRTVAENVGYGLKIRKIDAVERAYRVSAALAAVRLQGFEDRWPADLSGGQQQRVALARAIVVHPRVLLLDEPLSSLDPELRVDMQQTITEVQRTHATTSIVVTHDRNEARAMGDEVAVMLDGHVRQVGQPDEVFGQPIDQTVARFLGESGKALV